MLNSKILFGVDVMAKNPSISLNWGNCILLCNQASLASNGNHSVSVCRKVLNDRLLALMAPQHGLWGTVQDNMIETPHEFNSEFNLKTFSLYSETREPTEEMLAGVDTILVDLQITGCRVYTFKYTMSACLRAAKKMKKKVVVLDRPNPIGAYIEEGRCLDLNCRSFVGEYSIPMRHGLSIGEAAQFFNSFIGADLDVIKLENYSKNNIWSDFSRVWVPTSPNLPNFESLLLYPGMVIFEGTNISEGRGTSLPFQCVGAPILRTVLIY